MKYIDPFEGSSFIYQGYGFLANSNQCPSSLDKLEEPRKEELTQHHYGGSIRKEEKQSTVALLSPS